MSDHQNRPYLKYDIPFANNKATADFLIHSSYMEEEYNHDIIDFKQNIAHRAEVLPSDEV